MSKPLSLYPAIILLLTCVISSIAHAGRPLFTDDATLVEDCQIESWWQREQGEHAFWQLPACHVGGVELAVGAAKTQSAEADLFVLAAKTEILRLKPDSYGVTLQLEHELAEGNAMRGDTHLNFSLSKSWLADDWLLHLNAGYLRRYQARNDWTAGVAVQRQIARTQSVFIELYRETAGRPLYQLGYIIEPIRDRLQLDISFSNRLSGSGGQEFYSAGFVYYFSLY